MRIRQWTHIWAMIVVLLVGNVSLSEGLQTELDKYVKRPDATYSWKLLKTDETQDSSFFSVLELTSQTWRSEKEVSRPVWRHWLTVVKPKKLTTRKAFLYVGSGRSTDPQPQSPDPRWIKLALETGSIVVDLRQVPNQPLQYKGDGVDRVEDDSLAYSWDQAMTTGDWTWSLRFPMVKSVVKAMDAAQEFLKQEAPDGFVIAGASKRGWTTWLAAAVDTRVVAIIPMVIDALNVRTNFEHHLKTYGSWSSAVKDYLHHNIDKRLQTPEFARLMEIEDPFSYRQRITVPKLIINASGDQFFLPDSSQFYFHELKGETLLRYLPNTDHSMADSDAIVSAGAFYNAVIHGEQLPHLEWQKRPWGMQVKCKGRPIEVMLWQATNPKERDFRLQSIGKAFTATPLFSKNGVYRARVAKPAHGFTAYFVEATFSGSQPLKLTTEVQVVGEKTKHVRETSR